MSKTSKITEALEARERARELVISRRQWLRDAIERRDAAVREVADAEQKILQAQRQFVECNDKLKPLLDADMAGVLGGKKLEQPEDSAAS